MLRAKLYETKIDEPSQVDVKNFASGLDIAICGGVFRWLLNLSKTRRKYNIIQSDDEFYSDIIKDLDCRFTSLELDNSIKQKFSIGCLYDHLLIGVPLELKDDCDDKGGFLLRRIWWFDLQNRTLSKLYSLENGLCGTAFEANRDANIGSGVFVATPYSSKKFKNSFSISLHPLFVRQQRDISVFNNRSILIHSGNTVKDTAGCILPGLVRGINTVSQSRAAMEAFSSKIKSEALMLWM